MGYFLIKCSCNCGCENSFAEKLKFLLLADINLVVCWYCHNGKHKAKEIET